MAMLRAHDVDLFVDTFGAPDDPTFMFIAGLGAQSIGFDDELCERIAGLGLFVVRFDNRDSGLSQKFDHLPSDVWAGIQALGSGEPIEGYRLSDMADDAVGVLDALERPSAIVWGSSMGGMIAQQLAIASPERVDGLISVMSTTGESHVGHPRPDVLATLVESATPAASRQEAIERSFNQARLIGSPSYFDEAFHRRRHTALIDRGAYPEGTARQLLAMMASGDRAEGLAALTVPTLVIHGTADPLIDISGGRRTAELIPDANLVEVDGMGHDLPPALWDRYVAEIATELPRLGRRTTPQLSGSPRRG